MRWLRRGAGLAGIVGGLLILAGAVGTNVLGGRRHAGCGRGGRGLAVVVEDSVDRRRLRRGGGVFLVVGVVLLPVGIWLALP